MITYAWATRPISRLAFAICTREPIETPIGRLPHARRYVIGPSSDETSAARKANGIKLFCDATSRMPHYTTHSSNSGELAGDVRVRARASAAIGILLMN
jgi:hypothetical protein